MQQLRHDNDKARDAQQLPQLVQDTVHGSCGRRLCVNGREQQEQLLCHAKEAHVHSLRPVFWCRVFTPSVSVVHELTNQANTHQHNAPPCWRTWSGGLCRCCEEAAVLEVVGNKVTHGLQLHLNATRCSELQQPLHASQ